MAKTKKDAVAGETGAPIGTAAALGKNAPKLTIMALVLINVSAVLSIRGLPAQAVEGYSIIFYLIVGALMFFIPSALVSAELASGWPQEGGVFLWVKEAFGPRWGFLAVFMQWVENIPWFPAMLTFVSLAFANIINPELLANNRIFVFCMIIGLLWLSTLLNMKGAKWSTFLSSTGATVGVLIPGCLLIVLAVVYLAIGKPIAVEFSPDKLIPDFADSGKLLMLVTMVVGLTGIEMSAVHITEMDNPSKSYPKAVLISSVLMIIVNIIATLSIVVVMPPEQLSASGGVYDTFSYVLGEMSIGWLAPVIFVMIAYGALASVATWLVGPSSGVLAAAKDGYLPKAWSKTNKAGVPKNIMIIQAGIASLLALSVFFTTGIEDAFLLMLSLMALLYMTMYLLMFAAAIKLRYSKPEVERPYRIPGGKVGIWIVCGLGLAACLAAFVCGLLPPGDISDTGGMVGYYAFIVLGYGVLVAIPLVLYSRSQKKKQE